MKPGWQVGATVVSALAAPYLIAILLIARETITNPAFVWSIGQAPYLAALFVTLRAAQRNDSADRAGFLALALFLSSWQAACWIQNFETAPIVNSHLPDLATALLLAGYAFAVITVIKLAPAHAITDPRRGFETSAVLVIAIAVVVQYVLPLEGSFSFALVAAAGLPLLDIILLTMIVLSFFGDSFESPGRAGLLAASFATLFIVDAASMPDRSAGQVPSTVLELSRQSAIWLLALAAVSATNFGFRSSAQDNRLVAFAQSALPFALIVPAAIAVTVHAVRGEPVPGLTVGTFMAATLLLGRQWLVAADNRDLYTNRERLLTSFNAKTAELEREVIERRRAEVALRKTEERFRAVAENLDEGLLLANPSGRIIYANPRMAHLAGYDRSEFMGRRAQDVLEPWEDWQSLLEVQGAEEGNSDRREIPSVTFDGDAVWLEGYARTFHPHGDDAAVIAIAIDVTDRKLVEEEAVGRADDLSRHNEALEQLSSSTAFTVGGLKAAAVQIAELGAATLKAMSVSVWLVEDHDDERCLRLFARGPGGFQRNSAPAVPLNDCPTYLEALNNEGSLLITDSRQDPRVAEIAEVMMKPGSIVSALDVPIRLFGETEGIIRCEHAGIPRSWTPAESSLCISLAGFMATVLEADKRQQALSQATRLAAILSATPDMVSIFNSDGRATYLNPSARKTLGLTPIADISDVTIETFYLEESIAELTETALPAALSAGAWSGETTISAGDGRQIPISQVIMSQRDDGERHYVATIMRDLTDARRAAEDRENLNRKLQEAHKLESLGLLAGGIAHDFNNLLQAMLGNAQVVRMTIPPGVETAHESLAELETAAYRAGDLVSRLLAFAGGGQAGVSPTDPSSLVEETVKLLLAVVTKNATVTVNLRLAPELPEIDADQVQLRQVVMNLVTNAADAIGANRGVIDVHTSKVLASQAFLQECFLGETLSPGEYVAIEVKDSGAGMDHDTLARIFDPFFTTKSYGHGLGLAAVLGTVRSHGGALRVVSQPSLGTTFTVLLPTRAADENEQPLDGRADAA